MTNILKITKEEFYRALSEMAQSRVSYPLREGETEPVSAFLTDWFFWDAQDAVDFGVLEEPRFHSYSDIAVMQMEWYIEEILEGPFLNALKKLNIEVDGIEKENCHS